MKTERESKLIYGIIEMLYRKYSVDYSKAKHFFTKLDVRDYIVLHLIAAAEQKDESGNRKLYLKTVARKLNFPMRRASNMARELSDKGLVTWKHDGDGSEGTYITITEKGERLLKEQEDITWDHYSKVIDRFGKDNLENMLQLVERFDEISEQELPDEEESCDDDDEDMAVSEAGR